MCVACAGCGLDVDLSGNVVTCDIYQHYEGHRHQLKGSTVLCAVACYYHSLLPTTVI